MMKEQQKERCSLIKRALWLVLLTLSVFALEGQAQTVLKGTVLDAAGEPLVGATVVPNGNSKAGTVTDLNGQYTLKLGGAKTGLLDILLHRNENPQGESGRQKPTQRNFTR